MRGGCEYYFEGNRTHVGHWTSQWGAPRSSQKLGGPAARSARLVCQCLEAGSAWRGHVLLRLSRGPPPTTQWARIPRGPWGAHSQLAGEDTGPCSQVCLCAGLHEKIPFILEIYPHHVGQLIWTPQSWESPGPASAFRPNNTTHHTLSTGASHGPDLCALTWFSSYAGSLTLRVSQTDQPGGPQSLQCCQQLFPPRSPPLAVTSSALPAVGELW